MARRDSPACRPPPACRLEKGNVDCSSPLFISCVWICYQDVAKELLPEVLVLHGPDRPLGRLGVELQLERLVVADLLLVGRHVHS